MFPPGELCFTLLLFALLQVRPEKEKKQKEHQKFKQKTAAPPPQTLASRREFSSPSPSLPLSSSSSPSSSSGAAPTAGPVDQKKFADAAMRMIAEDMLPFRWVAVLVAVTVLVGLLSKIVKIPKFVGKEMLSCLCLPWMTSYVSPDFEATTFVYLLNYCSRRLVV